MKSANYVFNEGYQKAKTEDISDMVGMHTKELRTINAQIFQLKIMIIGIAVLVVSLNPTSLGLIMSLIK